MPFYKNEKIILKIYISLYYNKFVCEKKFPAILIHLFIYRFEKVFEQKTKQDEIFENVAKPVINK